jgi:cation diffusion facilitator CzcD-associated flavoprotein CzcO
MIDVRETPIETFTPTGIRTTGGHTDLGSVVLATGFDAVTGAALRMGIQGTNERTLNEHWAEGPRTYLGLMVNGFPNLFLAGGPLSPTVIYSTILGLEKHVEWISSCIAHLRENGRTEIDPREDSEQSWVDETAAFAAMTLHPKTDSWWMGANVPGKPRVFMSYLGGGPRYFQACDQETASGYEGFTLR